MSSVAMALAGFNVTIGGQTADPGLLNKWLIANGGYICLDNLCWNLKLDAPNALAPDRVVSLGEPLTPTVEGLQKLVDSGLVNIVHVNNQSHFVLVTDIDKDGTVTVLDPFYNTTTYAYKGLHDILLYDMELPKSL